MIDLSTFNKQSGKISHNLTNSWSQEIITNLCNQQIAKDIRYYRSFDNGGYTVGGVECHPYILEILNFLQPLKPNFFARAGIYASENDKSKTFPLHTDPGQHIWIWQIIGKTEWQVGNDYVILNNNELLYILPETPHRAIPIGPRVSISLSLEEFY